MFPSTAVMLGSAVALKKVRPEPATNGRPRRFLSGLLAAVAVGERDHMVADVGGPGRDQRSQAREIAGEQRP